MSKVAEYLNEHLLGEVTTSEAVRQKFSTDGSILAILPDMVVYPRATNDIRKMTRFSWQLAEKGHKFPITPRGGGTDQTGAAIGSGAVVDLTSHMNSIFEVDAKQRLIRMQPGVTLKSLNDALRLQGLTVPAYPASYAYSTIGGAIANNAGGATTAKYGTVGDWVYQLEIVLANGEVLQTGRVSKKEVARKKGLQTFEGEIYRGIDNLLSDNASLLESMVGDARDNVGYNIEYVRRKDGSIDLTPLFIGSQGTLGIVSEVIMRADTVSPQPLVCAIAFMDHDAARDGLDLLRQFGPSVMELVDARLIKAAIAQGKRYQFFSDAQDQGDVAAVVVLEFDQPNDRAKRKTGKKIAKLFEEQPTYVVLESDPEKAAELSTLRTTPMVALAPHGEMSAPSFLDGAYIPSERFEDFASAIAALETKYHAELPLFGHAGQHVYYSRLLLNMHKVSDKQKVFKLLTEWSTIVAAHDGHIVGEAAEGRLKAPFAYKQLDDEIKDIYAQVKAVFDPMEILNTGVKQVGDLKKLATSLRSDFDGSDFTEYSL